MSHELHLPVTRLADITTHHVDVLRTDLMHPVTGGNKHYKLKYNLAAARASPHRTLLTFGGAHSNHIAACAIACRDTGVSAIGLIRGDQQSDSPTLKLARSCGMRLIFLDRSTYAQMSGSAFIEDLRSRFGEFHLVPEGGCNAEGIKGASEIVPPDMHHDYVLCACGTGTTFAGIVTARSETSVVIGISVLKGENRLNTTVRDMPGLSGTAIGGDEALSSPHITRHCVLSAYGFSGYAAFDPELVKFKRAFEGRSGIMLDHVYTAKLFYAVYDLCRTGKIKDGARVLVIHSGGLQGNEAFENRYRQKMAL